MYNANNIFFDGSLDEFGNPVEKTKFQFPYSYDPFVTWRSDEKNLNANATVYTDRLYSENYMKYNSLSMKHFGNESQHWNDREPEQIEAFIKDWTNNDKLKLVLVMECCNVSTGYPLWRLDFSTQK